MNDLIKKKCVPCEGGVVPFDISEIHKYQKKVDGWDIIKDEKKNFYLNKKFKFKNFLDSQNFINKVGEISENDGDWYAMILSNLQNNPGCVGFHLCGSYQRNRSRRYGLLDEQEIPDKKNIYKITNANYANKIWIDEYS